MTLNEWRSMIEGLLEGVWLLDPLTLRLLASNEQAATMVGIAASDLTGHAVVDFAVTPEDICFWEDVAQGHSERICSDTLLRHADGKPVFVQRRVHRVWLDSGESVLMVAMRDLTSERETQSELAMRVSQLTATLEATAEGVLVTDLHGSVQSFNRRFVRMWGLPASVVQDSDGSALNSHMQSQVSNPVAYAQRLNMLLTAPLLESQDECVLVTGQTLERVSMPQMQQGQPIGRVFSFRDVTDQRSNQSSLQLAAKVFECSLDGIFITSADGFIVRGNSRFEQMTGSQEVDWRQRRALDLFYDTEDRFLGQRIETGLQQNDTWEGEVWCRCRDGTSFPAHLAWVVVRDELRQVQQTIGIFRDLTDTVAARKRIEELAYNDPLTGIPNRLALAQRVGVALSLTERRGGSFAIAFIDLDRFKNVNDSFGQLTGDRVLREVAQRISQCLRQEDFLCRLSGDEFAVFLNGADARGAETLVRRVISLLGQPFALDGFDFSVGCSVGVAMYPSDGLTLEALLSSADNAMHRVKEHGRGSFRFYQPQINVDLLARMKMEHAMRKAMENSLFRLHYQPKVDLQSGQVLGAEALLRWRDEALGEVSPGVFIPLAEESGLIVSIGAFVLEQAVRQAAMWMRAGKPLVVAINVSALQFQQTDFVQKVALTLVREGLRANLLELELTESILIQGVDEALQRLRALSALGVGLAIDDFGVGYSSLGYLKQFPIHTLKIDRSFVMGLPANDSDVAIVQAIVNMGHALRLQVVAEGVETRAQHDALRSMGCDQFQGFLCAKGLPVPEFDQFMVEGWTSAS